ncbi:checkpoint protein Hus1/Mec3 [Schizophyllum commune]
MRFRATVENVNLFFRLIQSVEKLQKKCIIRFTEETMHIICNHDANEGGIQVWSQIKVDVIFTSYRIQSNANNEITMALASDALLATLRSCTTHESDDITVKLAKKNEQAVLSFEISGFSRVGQRVRVAHDVRIDVMKPADVERLGEPMCPDPDANILLPPLQKLRTVVERMRIMSDVLAIRANGSGCLQLAIHTDDVSVDTVWRNCTNPKMPRADASSQDDAGERDPDQYHSVFVNIRSFIKFLNAHVVSSTTMACICQNHCMILYVYIGDVATTGGVLTFYIPAIIDDEDG